MRRELEFDRRPLRVIIIIWPRVAIHRTAAGPSPIARPLVGVVSSWNEAAPCNISLKRQAAVPSSAAGSGDTGPRQEAAGGPAKKQAKGKQGRREQEEG